MPASRFAYAVGGVQLGLGVVCLAFGVLLVFAGLFPRGTSDLAGIAFIGGVALLPIGATLMLSGFAARRGWRRWYWYAVLPLVTPLAMVLIFRLGLRLFS